MKGESWFGRIKRIREMKKKEKLRREFSFLTDMINLNYNRMVEEIQQCENDIRESQEKLGDINDEVKIIIKTIMDQINIAQKETKSNIESGNAVLENKLAEILLNVEEEKALMKIVAVNNLIDEIEKETL